MVGDGDIKYDKYNKFDNKNIHTHSNEVEYSALFMALEIYWRLPPRKSSLVKHTQRTYSPPAVVSSSPNRLSYLFIIYIIRYSFSTFFLYIYFIDIVTERKKNGWQCRFSYLDPVAFNTALAALESISTCVCVHSTCRYFALERKTSLWEFLLL